MRHLIRPVCAVLRCKPEVIGSRHADWSAPRWWPTTRYRCTRCHVEWWG